MTPVEIARSWIGTPWHHQGRGPVALDCIGLLVKCFPVEDRFDYDRNPRAGTLESEVERQFGAPVSDMRAGDVVLLAFPRVIRHVGIVADYYRGGLSLIHTWNGGPRCVTEMPLDDQWRARIKRVHRWSS